MVHIAHCTFRLRLNNFYPLFWMNPKSCWVLYSGLGKRFTWCTIGSQDQGFSHQPSGFTMKQRYKTPIWNGFTGMTVSTRTVSQIQNMTKTVCRIWKHFILHQDISSVPLTECLLPKLRMHIRTTRHHNSSEWLHLALALESLDQSHPWRLQTMYWGTIFQPKERPS